MPTYTNPVSVYFSHEKQSTAQLFPNAELRLVMKYSPLHGGKCSPGLRRLFSVVSSAVACPILAHRPPHPHSHSRSNSLRVSCQLRHQSCPPQVVPARLRPSLRPMECCDCRFFPRYHPSFLCLYSPLLLMNVRATHQSSSVTTLHHCCHGVADFGPEVLIPFLSESSASRCSCVACRA